MKIRSFVAVFVWLCLALTSCAPATPPAADLPDLGGIKITIAVENGYPPFNNIDEASGQGDGWDYDTVKEICRRLNCVPEFHQAPWEGIFEKMAAGEYDVLADGITYTQERDQIVDFSVPYITVSQVLLVRVEDTRELRTLLADPGAIIGAQVASTNEITARETFTNHKLQLYEKVSEAVTALLDRQLDALVMDNITAAGYIRENQDKLKITAEIKKDEKLAFVFPPGSELKPAFDAALQAMQVDGTLDMLNKKWKLVE
jgi:polar amino acid transport system substrate-binding protein